MTGDRRKVKSALPPGEAVADQHAAEGRPGKVTGPPVVDRNGSAGQDDEEPELELELSEEQIIAWAQGYHARFRSWPKPQSGAIPEAPGTTWHRVDLALRLGACGLPGGSSLARVLGRHRGLRRTQSVRPPLTEEQILGWMDAHRARTGVWPNHKLGPIPESGGECWGGVNSALYSGRRGLPGGSSLKRLLGERRGVRNKCVLPLFSEELILAWADAHRARTGTWPSLKSGPVPEAVGENWNAINAALYHGLRGLAGGSSLARLLADNRGVHVRHGRAPRSAPPGRPVKR